MVPMMRGVKEAASEDTKIEQRPLAGIGGTSKLRQTIQRLAEMLFAEGICVHGKVPSERRLEQLTGVSRRTIRAALLELDRLDVTRRVGPRTRVLNESARAFVEARPDARPPVSAADHPTLLRQTVLLVRHRLISVDDNPDQFRGRPSHVGEAFQEYAYRHDRPVLQMRPGLLLRRQEREVRSLPVSGAVLTEDAAERPDAGRLIRRLRDADIPVVVQSDSASFDDVDIVRSDHEAGAQALTRWLLQHAGPRLVQYDGGLANELPASAGVWINARRSGHRRAMREAGHQPAPVITAADHQPVKDENRAWFDAEVRQAIRRVGPAVERGLDAIILLSDTLVGPVATALRELGREPGRDVRLAGYDNFWRTFFTRRFETCPPDVTVDKRHGRMAAVALSLLDKRIEAQDHRRESPSPRVVRTVKPKLVVV